MTSIKKKIYARYKIVCAKKFYKPEEVIKLWKAHDQDFIPDPGNAHTDTIRAYPKWELVDLPTSKLRIHPVTNKENMQYMVDNHLVEDLPPIICVPEAGMYRVLDGEHRGTAAKKLGLEFIQSFIPVAQKVQASNDFMTKLNAAFATLIKKTAFQKQVLKEAEKNEGETDEEILDNAFGKLYPKWMWDLERRGTFKANHLVIYRAISAKAPEDIDLNKAGIFWTWDRKKAANYSDKNTKLPIYILTALATIPKLDLSETLRKLAWNGYSHEDSEREITLKKGQHLPLLEVTDAEGKKVDLKAKAVVASCAHSQ